jgi:hypothetical protein
LMLQQQQQQQERQQQQEPQEPASADRREHLTDAKGQDYSTISVSKWEHAGCDDAAAQALPRDPSQCADGGRALPMPGQAVPQSLTAADGSPSAQPAGRDPARSVTSTAPQPATPELASDAAGAGGRSDEGVFCAHFVGNAAVHGDEYTWHVDADPASLPGCRSAG